MEGGMKSGRHWGCRLAPREGFLAGGAALSGQPLQCLSTILGVAALARERQNHTCSSRV